MSLPELNHQDTKTTKASPRKDLSSREEELAQIIVDAAIKVHRCLGPGLLESVYETCLRHELLQRGLKVDTQVQLPITYEGLKLEDALRLDLLVEDLAILEIKAVEEFHPVHEAQLLTYLKLAHKRLGFLINFNVSLLKDGLKRRVL